MTKHRKSPRIKRKQIKQNQILITIIQGSHEPALKYLKRINKLENTIEARKQQLELCSQAYDDNFSRILQCEKKSIEHQKLLLIEDCLTEFSCRVLHSLGFKK